MLPPTLAATVFVVMVACACTRGAAAATLATPQPDAEPQLAPVSAPGVHATTSASARTSGTPSPPPPQTLTPALVPTPTPPSTAAGVAAAAATPAAGHAPAPVQVSAPPAAAAADNSSTTTTTSSATPASTATGLPPTTATPPSVTEDEPEPPAEPEPESPCVHVDEKHCPPMGELCRCKLLNGTSTVICCDVTTQLQLMESLNCHSLAGTVITALHARNITLYSLDVGVFNLTKLSLPQLESLAITDGHITEIKGNLSAKNLACLNLSSNSLINVSNENTFLSLPSLTSLDLSGNDLQHIFNVTADVNEFVLDVSGNNKLSCDSIMDLIKKMKTLRFCHDNTTYCLSPKSYHWFNVTEKIPLSSVVMLSKLEEDCPHWENGAECSCRPARLDMVPGKPPMFSVEVDCSNRHLTSLPEMLPKYTINLNVSSNNITNLEALGVNAAYEDVRKFYADDNQITSITALEGSTFINTFHTLSLRNNKISSLPTYILSNVFDRTSWDAQIVFLGLNRLKCDCSTAQSIKMWLNANSMHIPDYDQVQCENMPERVYDLDQDKVCTVQSDWTEYVYYVVALEVLLLILLISKVSYDYWVFKTAGYLPWPASKMPKLPCDWVFES